ncbi:hypothetical protein [Streptomyces albireticuli]|uniref:Uncharacterized protein n=1 Tax=Streptomyces albireticuli TaxID=1940 RepID=A0A2A2DA50_9ACTN|nr:hypothetical protein [Streptomyces albireticuli]MCD9145570.1 hypothetical protein [Streptomyces albireticuli]MCD9165140.1 hypothetical protein [Streptomyces albireticuli]MCD9195669.1 hypothetical protein [Streptomyces albireticuli]PAU49348.1 hypothetical protein CK936_08365 [Streptomyces albireticuli]
MPLIPEEPQIHESVPGPRAVPNPGRSAQTPRPVPGPGPRPVPTRPVGAGSDRGPIPSPRAPRATATAPATPAPAAGPQVQLIPAPAQGALDAADEAVDLLLDTGREPGEILVLTTGDPHPWAAHELSFGEASYWAQHDAGDDVFYAAADATRVKPRPVVILAVNGGGDEAVTAAVSRAGALLVVCGDPQRVNALLPAGV